MAEFTQGPWVVDLNLTDGGAPIVVAPTTWHTPIGPLDRTREVAKVLFYGGSEDPHVQANAALIASAPDLYEALKHVRAVAYGAAHDPDVSNNRRQVRAEILQKVDAALAKAGGQG